jgi:hypothetical protein
MAIGFLWSLIPKKMIGLAGFLVLYFAIAAWYTATFNFQMLIFSTFYLLYVIVGLAGFALGTYLSRKGIIKISATKGNLKANKNMDESEDSSERW